MPRHKRDRSVCCVILRPLLPSVVALTLACLLTQDAHATTRNVPQQYPTIQAAINAAKNGDTVAVANGVWSGSGNVNLDPLGKAITIQAPGGANATILDGEGASPLFHLHSGETSTTLITGFTLRHGSSVSGGGVSCLNSSPSFTHCTFAFNSASANGGGLSGINSSPTLTNCTFTQNSAANGGGVSLSSGSAAITHCVFEDNAASAGGGGVWVGSDSSSLKSCTFTSNQALTGGGAYVSAGSTDLFKTCTFTDNTATNGGAVFVNAASPFLTRSTFDNNEATSTDASYSNGGGAISISSDNASTPIIYRSTFSNNMAINGGALNISGNSIIASNVFSNNGADAIGGALLLLSGKTIVVNSVFTGNTADTFGGAVDMEGNSVGTFTNCTFTGNMVLDFFGYGDAIFADTPISGADAVATVYNCIVWDDQDPQADNELVAFNLGAIPATYTNVFGGYYGTGNMSADPMFVSAGNLSLSSGSPCLSMGSGKVPYFQTVDIDDTSRSPTHPSLGAYEH